MDTTSSPAPSRRNVLQLLAAGAAVAGLPACGSGGSDPGTVGWQAIPSYSLQSSDPKRVEYLSESLRAFDADSPVSVNPLVTSADTAAAMAKLLLQASQGRAPDVSQVDGYVFGRMARFAKPLDQRMQEWDLQLDDWFPSLQDVMTSGRDSVRGLQFTTDVRVLYYRKDLIDRPPASWDELISLAPKLQDNGAVFTFPAGRSEGAVTTTLWPQYWAQGQDLFDADGEPAFFTGPGYDAMLNALTIVQQNVASGASPARIATFGAEDNQNADIVAGRVGMFIGGNWQAAALNNLMPDTDFYTEFGVAPIPTVSGEDPVTSAGGWVWAGFADEDEKLSAGMDWVQRTFVSDEGMAAWCSIGGYLPPRQSIYEQDFYTQDPFTETFRDHLANYARGRPGQPKYLQVSNAMQVALSSVAAGSAEPSQALDSALNRLI